MGPANAATECNNASCPYAFEEDVTTINDFVIKQGYDSILGALVRGDVGFSWTPPAGAPPSLDQVNGTWAIINGTSFGMPTLTDPNIKSRTAAGIDVATGKSVTRMQRTCRTGSPSNNRCASFADVVVKVTTADGSVYDADMVVSAVPLGVLKAGSITFDPPLPPEKISAVGQAGFGNLHKIVLYYDSPGCSGDCKPPFWTPDTDYVQFHGLARPGGDGLENLLRGYFNYWVDMTAVVSTAGDIRPVLVGFATGDSVVLAELLSDSFILNHANETLTDIFGSYSAPKRVQRHNWGADVNIKGSRSYWAKDNTHRTWHDVQRPVEDWLFFTGEHSPGCVDLPGWTDANGASCEDYFTKGYCHPGQFFGPGVVDALPGAKTACCACGGGNRRFDTKASGTVHGALMAGRETAREVLLARDRVVLPRHYDCSDDTGPILKAYPNAMWVDTGLPDENRSCEYYRMYPYKCNAPIKVILDPSEADALPVEQIGVVRAMCKNACGTCPSSACDSFPCHNGGICHDAPTCTGNAACDAVTALSDSTACTSAGCLYSSGYTCDCGSSGYTGHDCDEDYNECYYGPCDNGDCFESNTPASQNDVNVDPRTQDVDRGTYVCDCYPGYLLDGSTFTLPNGYTGESCVTCESWINPNCSEYVVPIASAVIFLLIGYIAYRGTNGKTA